MSSHYEAPRSQNMLSHLTNAQALKDYKRETARKLVMKQEELLRNLSKVRNEMEQEESQIGKTKDYYSGSRKERFEHTLNLADKLRNQRFADKKVDGILKEAAEEAKLPISSASYSDRINDLYTVKNVSFELPESYKTASSNLLMTTPLRSSHSGSKNLTEIQKLKDQVENVAKRYRSDYPDDNDTKFNLYTETYYPGACYVKDMAPVEERETGVSGTDIAQYFPVTRYVLY